MFGWSFPRNHLALALMAAPALVTILYNTLVIIFELSRKREREQARALDSKGVLTAPERYETSLLVAAYRCVPPAFVFWAFMTWALLSPSDLLGRSPRLMLWTIGISNAKLVTAIMLAHVCDEEYHPFSRTIACLCTLLVHVMFHLKWHRDGVLLWDIKLEDLLLQEAFTILLGSYVHMVYAMVYEVSHALGIYAFTITKKRSARAPVSSADPPVSSLSASPPRPSPAKTASPPRQSPARVTNKRAAAKKTS